MKTIVTHISPDLDALTSLWLIKTFFPDWREAALAFVPAGQTLDKVPVDSDPEVIHVDTGFGKFDHHQTADDTCAAKLIYEEIVRLLGADVALERLILQVNEIDHFREVSWPDPTSDIWSLHVISVIDGWRLIYSSDSLKIAALGFDLLDAIYKSLQNKVWAESEIKSKGQEFSLHSGRALAIETVNDEVVHLAQKSGFVLAVRKDPKTGYLRIKAVPNSGLDLSSLYAKLKNDEPEASWFLHASHLILLNGSKNNPEMRPSKRPLAEIVAVIKSVLQLDD